MSSVSTNSSGLSANWYSRLQASNNQSSGSATNVGNTNAPQTEETTGDGSSTQKAHHHHHHGGGGGGGGALFQNIQNAVTSALQSTSNDGSTDVNKVVEQALAQVFQQGLGAEGAGPPPGAAPSDSTSQKPGVQGSPNGGGGNQAFLDLLQSYGIDPQQFKADLRAAVKDARGGEVDQGTLFQSVPSGASVDTNV